jgi:uracil-DNA glycosylase
VQNVKDKLAGNSEQGCSLDEGARIQTLKAMGIQSWFSKYAPAQDIEEPPQSVVESPESSAQINLNPDETPAVESISVSDAGELNWQQLQQAISECQLCELHTSRSQTVFGMGNASADLMIIGEAPGEDEDRKGEPFVGPSGQLLDAMLKAIGLNREHVFIANVLKCRPPEDRNPHVSEIVCCDAYLQRQIELVQPKLILALGRVAAHHLLVSKEPLGALREKPHHYNGIPLLVSYHPAYLLRKPIEKRKSWQDLLQVKNVLGNS